MPILNDKTMEEYCSPSFYIYAYLHRLHAVFIHHFTEMLNKATSKATLTATSENKAVYIYKTIYNAMIITKI